MYVCNVFFINSIMGGGGVMCLANVMYFEDRKTVFLNVLSH